MSPCSCSRRFPASSTAPPRWLRVYDSPNLLFLLAIAFLLLVCVYFSWELSRLEARSRILAEELALLRGESVDAGQTPREGD